MQNIKGCSCGNAFYCDECQSVEDLVCSSCYDVTEFEALNQAHIEILKQIKFYCANKTQGCNVKLHILDIH
jgi:hypothetical protein